MSRELITWVEAKNEKDEWYLLQLFNGYKRDITDEFLFFNYAKEKLCTDGEEGLMDNLRGFPPKCSKEIMDTFTNCGADDDIYSFEAYKREATWYDWCELKALSRTPEAEEIDWYAVDEMSENEIDVSNLPTVNRIKEVVERIELLMEMNGINSYNVKPGEVRVVCFLSF